MKSLFFNKKGSHVEVILSMVIFMGFFVFLFIILEPNIRVQEDEKFILDNIQGKMIDRISANLTTATIKVYGAPSGDCISFDDFGSEPNLIVWGSNTIIDSTTDGLFTYINWDLLADNFFKIYYSEEEFNNPTYTSGTCDTLSQNDYLLGIVKTEKNIFQSRIEDFMNQTSYEYEYSKQEIGIPGPNEFTFKFRYANGTEVNTSSSSIAKEIYSQKIPIEYIDKEARLKVGEISLTVW